MKSDHRSEFSNLSNWKKARKNQGFHGIRTHDLRDTSEMLYQLSYDYRSANMNYFIYTLRHFTPHGRYKLNKLTSLPTCGFFIFHIYFSHFTAHGRYKLNKLTSLPMCGFIAQLVEHRTGIAEVMVRIPLKP